MTECNQIGLKIALSVAEDEGWKLRKDCQLWFCRLLYGKLPGLCKVLLSHCKNETTPTPGFLNMVVWFPISLREIGGRISLV